MSLSKAHLLLKILVIPRKWWLRPNMTEKLFTGTLRINQPTISNVTTRNCEILKCTFVCICIGLTEMKIFFENCYRHKLLGQMLHKRYFDVVPSRSIFDKSIFFENTFHCLDIKIRICFSSEQICTLRARTKRKVSGFFCG